MTPTPRHPDTPTPRRARRAFTLLELILVLLVLAVIVGMTVPSLRGVSRGRGIEDCSGQLLALSQYARSQAIAEGVNYRLNVDVNNRTYYLTRQEGLDFVDLGVEYGRLFVVPPNVQIEWDDTLYQEQQVSETGRILPERDGSTTVPYIEFRPSGRNDPGLIRLIDNDGAVTQLVCPSATETMRIVRPDGSAQF